MANRKISKLLTKKNLLLYVIIVVVLIGASILYKRYSERTVTPAESVQDSGPKINLDPPTEQEINETEAHKERLSNEAPRTTTDTNTYGKTKVTPIITSASQNELRSFISGIVEDGGTCIATFRQGSASFTKQSEGFGNVNTTICGVIQLDRSDFAASGEWTVTLEYTSNNSAGISEQSKFGVQ